MGCVSSSPTKQKEKQYGVSDKQGWQKNKGEPQSKYVTSAVGGLGTSSRSEEDCRREGARESAAHATGTRDYSSWVELRVAATNLKSADTFSKSDPLVALFSQEKDGWKEVARTEVVGNNESPTFLKAFRILYNFEQVQNFRLEVVDVDARHNAERVPVYECNRLGNADFRLSQILTAPEQRLSLDLQNTTRKSQIHVMAEELSACRDVVTMQIAASGLKNVELLSKSDPYLEISCQDSAGRWKPVFKTEVKMNNLNPVWNMFTVRGTQLHNGDPSRPLLLRVWDYESSGKNNMLGEVETSMSALVNLAGSGSLPLYDPKHKGEGQRHAGALQVKSLAVVQQPTFLDYVQAGAEINFLCGIDYTASNKDPRDPESLHYLSPTDCRTPYEEAIAGVAQVLQAYDKDNVFQCFGFGCKIPGSTVEHCAPLGPDGTAACQGIQGIMAAYRQALFTRALSGPTLFGPLLKQAAAIASSTSASSTSGLRYTVCLILTDGCIHDMQDSVDTIVSASTLPMSIIIVGVGSSPELEHMKALDSDKKVLLDRNGIAARRDIVQYVNFLDFRNDGEELARELLAELPGQFLEWCRINNMPVPSSAAQSLTSPLSASPFPSVLPPTSPHPSMGMPASSPHTPVGWAPSPLGAPPPGPHHIPVC